jgi:hypothetical protein
MLVEQLNPIAREAMKERRITLLDGPKMLTEQMIRRADLRMSLVMLFLV